MQPFSVLELANTHPETHNLLNHLIDPLVEIRPSEGQMEDIYKEVRERIDRHERSLILTLTKKMAEDLQEILLKTGYLSHIIECKGPKDCVVYVINYNPNSRYTKIGYPSNKQDARAVPYKGLVWCLNLKKNGVFLLRRNGKEFFCGNCANEFVRKAFEYGAERIIFLLRFNYCESGKVREDILGGGHLRRVFLIKERLSFVPFGWTGKVPCAQQNHAWFLWDKDFNAPVPSEFVVRRISLKEGKYFKYTKGIR